MKLKRRALAVVLALVAVLAIPVGAYAATNYAVAKQGQYYIVDSVVGEQTVDGILVQTISRKYIPENRYNANNPQVPYNSGNNGYWDNNGNWVNNGGGNQNWNAQNGNRTQILRNAGINSANSIMSYASGRKWTYSSPRENYSNDAEFSQYLYFRCDYSSRYDYVDIDFTEKVTFDQNWNPVVRYYHAGVAYTENDLKAMFDKSY